MDTDSILRYRGELAIVIGFVLVLNPLVVSAYDIGDPDQYRYEPVEVEFHDNGTYAYDDSPSVHPLDSDVACFDIPQSRTCVLERAIHANSGITFDGPPRMFMNHDYDYVFIWESGFFQPVTTEENETVRYGLEPVPQEEALGYIATPLSRTSSGVQTAISQGNYVTSDELNGAHELVSTDEGYFVVSNVASSVDPTSERTAVVIALQWILSLTGAFLTLRGQRQRVERE